MIVLINRLKLVFLAVFAVACVGVWTYQLMYARPKAKCEAHAGWWDWHGRTCATPIPIYKLTGRGEGQRAVKVGPPAEQAAPVKPADALP